MYLEPIDDPCLTAADVIARARAARAAFLPKPVKKATRPTPPLELALKLASPAVVYPKRVPIKAEPGIARDVAAKKIVCAHYNVSKVMLESDCREKVYFWPRAVVVYLLRTYEGYSYPRLGKSIGGRDHTTAMNAYQRAVERLETDKEFLETYSAIEAEYAQATRRGQDDGQDS